MIWAQLDAITNRLTNIRQGYSQYANDVQLNAMPSGFGPFTYDSVNKLAVPANLTFVESLEAVQISKAVYIALIVLNSTTATPTQKAKAQTLVDNTFSNIMSLFN